MRWSLPLPGDPRTISRSVSRALRLIDTLVSRMCSPSVLILNQRRYMRIRWSCSIILLSTVLGVGAVTSAASAELKVLTSRAIATVLDVVGPQFERTTGNKLTVVTGFSPELIKRINAGEPFDIL